MTEPQPTTPQHEGISPAGIPGSMNDTDRSAYVEQLATEWASLDAARAELEHSQTTIKAELRRMLGYGKHPAGPYGVTITPNRRFTAKRATAVLPADVLATITVPIVDRATAQRLLPEDVYVSCQEDIGEPRVSIR